MIFALLRERLLGSLFNRCVPVACCRRQRQYISRCD